MENRTKRDLSFLNRVSDFEANFEKGIKVNYEEKTFLEIIRFYEEELQYGKALEVADIALTQYPYRSDFYIIKARLLFQTNFHQEALDILCKAEKLSPYESDISILKIRILAFQGKITEAKNILEEMKSVISSDDLSDLYLSESYIDEYMQDYLTMYDHLTKAVISDMTNEEAMERLGFAVQLCKNFNQSVAFHETILDEEPYNYLAWYNLGHAFNCLGEYSEAIDALEYSFIVEHNFENGYLDCADICIQEKRYQRALTIYESYISTFGINEEVLINMAECEYELENLNRARIILNKLLKLDPYNDEVYFKLGLCYSKAEKWNKAINAFHKAITLENQCEDYYLQIAHAHYALGSYSKAEFFFRQAVSIGPERSMLWKDFVVFLIKIGKRKEALDLIEESDACTFGPELIYCKAVAMYVSNMKEAAYKIFEEALIEDFKIHQFIFQIEPELMLDTDLQAMISYYRGEISTS